MEDTSYVTDNEQDVFRGSDEVREKAEVPKEERPLWARCQDEVFGRLKVASIDDDSDLLVCEKWDEPNYNSADHGYYP
jgi:hypothetical protein